MTQPLILISAMSSNRVIGTKNGMPWNVPDEYQQYLNFITDQTVVMGRKSYEIFGPDLTSKNNFVISRSMREGEGYQVFDNLEDALTEARKRDEKIFVAGGSSIYAQALPEAEEMYLSVIKGDYDGIAYFPEIEPEDWLIVEHKEHPQFSFYRYKRKLK